MGRHRNYNNNWHHGGYHHHNNYYNNSYHSHGGYDKYHYYNENYDPYRPRMKGVQKRRPFNPSKFSYHQDGRQINTLYIRVGCDDESSKKFVMRLINEKKERPLYITPWKQTWNGETQHIFVKFRSIDIAKDMKEELKFTDHCHDAYVEYARKEIKNTYNLEINDNKEEKSCQLPNWRDKFIEKDEILIFHPISQNFRTRKVKMNDKETAISREVVGSKYNKSRDDNLIFDNLKVAYNHAMISSERNGLKSQFCFRNLGDDLTLINKTIIGKLEKRILKSGDIIQFGRKDPGTDQNKYISPIITQIEIIEKRFRPVIVDGCNVCHGFRNDPKKFHLDGLQSVYDCFKKLGYEDENIHIIMKPPPEHAKTRDYDQVIKEFQEKNILHFTPARFSGPQNRLTVSDDDLFILNTAKQLNGVVLSKDQYRKEKAAHPEYAEVISYRVLQPRFIGGLCILPDDPMGNNGPSLRQFLELA